MGNSFSNKEESVRKETDQQLGYTIVNGPGSNRYNSVYGTLNENKNQINPENKVDSLTSSTIKEEKQEKFSESKNTAMVVPPIFATKDDFFMTWFSWKKEFFAYLKNIDKTEEKGQMWGIMLLNRMGPIGQEIHRTFSFYDKTEDINVLIKKFDIYCTFGDKKRNCEDIDKYVNDLKLIAIKNYTDPTHIVKEKIIHDISSQNFTGKAAYVIGSKEKLILNLQSLCLDNIISFWKQCENLMESEIKETLQEKQYKETLQTKQEFSYSKTAATECVRCGTEHIKSKCPAWGIQCSKCNQLNHFTEKCKVKYVDNCTRCGSSHILSRCPAYGETCIKCGKKNHFSSKCHIPFINNCSKCGMNHAISKCPAQGQICNRCKKLNHMEEHCVTQLDNEQ